MKTTKIPAIALLLIMLSASIEAQTLNWAGLQADHRQIVNVNGGMEYGLNYGVCYGYKIINKYVPAFASVEFSAPTGQNLFDDYKGKLGVQIRWFDFNGLQFITRIHGVFRKFRNDFVRLSNFGSDLSGALGYYRSKWFIAAEIGYDKAIVTHFKLSNKYRAQFSSAINGWYEPPGGGNVYFGLQGGVSFKRHDVYVKGGKIITEDFKSAPMIPFYGQLGYNYKF